MLFCAKLFRLAKLLFSRLKRTSLTLFWNSLVTNNSTGGVYSCCTCRRLSPGMVLQSVPLEATVCNKGKVNIPAQSASYLDTPENALLPLPFTSNTQSRPSHFLFLANSLMDWLAAHRSCWLQQDQLPALSLHVCCPLR